MDSGLHYVMKPEHFFQRRRSTPKKRRRSTPKRKRKTTPKKRRGKTPKKTGNVAPINLTQLLLDTSKTLLAQVPAPAAPTIRPPALTPVHAPAPAPAPALALVPAPAPSAPQLATITSTVVPAWYAGNNGRATGDRFCQGNWGSPTRTDKNMVCVEGETVSDARGKSYNGAKVDCGVRMADVARSGHWRYLCRNRHVARYITISRIDNKNEAINLASFTVYDELGNMITDLAHSMSAPYNGSATQFGSQHVFPSATRPKGYMVHTTVSASAFVKLDLKRDRQISKIVIRNRGDCCQSRIVGTRLTVTNQANAVVFRADFLQPSAVYEFTL